MLADIGLSPAEEAVYQVLLQRPEASLEMVAAESGLSARQTARLLDRLRAHGLVNRLPGGRRAYVAVSPAIGIEALIQAREDGLNRTRREMQVLASTFDSARRGSHPGQLIEVIIGQDNVTERFDQLQQGAKHQVCVFDRPPYARRRPGTNQVEETMLSRRVQYRAVYDVSALAGPGRLASVQRDIERGEEARVHPALPVKMVLVDGVAGLLPFVDSGREGEPVASAILVHPSSLLDGLNALFESEWERARPLDPGGSVPAPTDPEQDETDGQILAMLAVGLTDKALSRALRLSPRTVQRRVQSLMRRLDAVTRFQAGVEAGRRGWLGSAGVSDDGGVEGEGRG